MVGYTHHLSFHAIVHWPLLAGRVGCDLEFPVSIGVTIMPHDVHVSGWDGCYIAAYSDILCTRVRHKAVLAQRAPNRQHWNKRNRSGLDEWTSMERWINFEVNERMIVIGVMYRTVKSDLMLWIMLQSFHCTEG